MLVVLVRGSAPASKIQITQKNNEKASKNQSEAQFLKEKAAASAMEKVICETIVSQIQTLQALDVVIRVCGIDTLYSELCGIRVDWVITIGDNLLYIKACRLIYNRVPIVGINLDPYATKGSLCLFGSYLPRIVSNFRDIMESYVARQRIQVEIIYPEFKARKEKRADVNNEVYNVLNEIYIGNVKKEEASEMELLQAGGFQAKKIKFQEIMMLTGTGYHFRKDSFNKMEMSKAKVLDMYRELDEDTANRLMEFKIQGYELNENSKKFVAITKKYNKKVGLDTSIMERTKMGLVTREDNLLVVLDGVKNMKLPKGTLLIFTMERETSLNTYRND
ncbi:hypothetical protein GCK72_022231 [Caenorhabditis remanei]|uniref:Uncharacterized protein n=1 Tax=Caenorhabditis remanei TaxID=31234 RepID=A0A6A5FT97_CAERE|nr:hypothetical protein GCK72_022231 [Caenorhabditis remanei]KAF1745784.1 hypothetical protein GCK72_022231 [Caenorhabditis remanei]